MDDIRSRMVLQDIFVYEQPDFVFWVVHQTENTYRTGSDVKVLFHKFRFGKGKTGAADLLGESGCFELFAAWKDQQIEGGFLGIAKEIGFCRSQCLKAYLLPGMLP